MTSPPLSSLSSSLPPSPSVVTHPLLSSSSSPSSSSEPSAYMSSGSKPCMAAICAISAAMTGLPSGSSSSSPSRNGSKGPAKTSPPGCTGIPPPNGPPWPAICASISAMRALPSWPSSWSYGLGSPGPSKAPFPPKGPPRAAICAQNASMGLVKFSSSLPSWAKVTLGCARMAIFSSGVRLAFTVYSWKRVGVKPAGSSAASGWLSRMVISSNQ
mmetsp:Transcript_23092/g.59184  ORF Transcript_23092/g.59184 Transcript_23092/m.59184 type:complete len:214 (+) Transcript_23092:347-988(+)